jgi:hypothetical protein
VLCIGKQRIKPSKTMAFSPEHYGNNWKVGDFIVEQNLSFFQANAVKYICRCEFKGDKVKDLTKAIHYLQHELEQTIYESELTGPSGGISHSLQFASDWEDSCTDPEMFDR